MPEPTSLVDVQPIQASGTVLQCSRISANHTNKTTPAVSAAAQPSAMLG